MNTSAQTIPHDFEPEFDDKRMYELEENAKKAAKTDAINRRLVLAILARSYKQLREGLDDKDLLNAMMDTLENIAASLHNARNTVNLLDTASNRLAIVLADHIGVDLEELLRGDEPEEDRP